MDLRYFYWIIVGFLTYDSPNRAIILTILAVIYFIGVMIEKDIPGISFGINSTGSWVFLYPEFEYGPNLFAIWVIIISLNYLFVKAVWKRNFK